MNDHISPEEAYLISKDFRSFLESTQKYCTFIESFVSQDSVSFLVLTHRHLLNLYQGAITLQSFGFERDIMVEDPTSESFQKELVVLTTSRLSPYRYYWHQFDPVKESKDDLVCGDLVDDLVDIYKDLKNALRVYTAKKPGAKNVALIDFKNSFNYHWGRHCINALYGIHYFIQDNNGFS